MIKKHLSQRFDIKQLIHEFQDIFPDSPPKTSWIKHDVDAGANALTNLLKKEIKFMWTPVAGAIRMGAVLMQVDDNGIDHPVSFYSKKLDKHQQNYSAVEKEALSLLSSLPHYNVYLGSSPHVTIVYSDQNPLVFCAENEN